MVEVSGLRCWLLWSSVVLLGSIEQSGSGSQDWDWDLLSLWLDWLSSDIALVVIYGWIQSSVLPSS